MEICISIAAKIAEYAVGPILHHARYLCCFNNFAGNLPHAKEELELTRDSVKEQVKEASNRTETIEPTVEKWLKDVEKVLEEVQLLEARIPEIRKSYFRRRCQYFLAKEIAEKTEKMIQLNRDSKFEPFSRITELPGMKYYSSKGFVFFKSTESTSNKLLEALKDESVCMIGLVGIGGSGKTTLAKEVGKKAEELKLFDKVVMATVSQTPNIRSIQAQIADKLGIKFEEESDEGRAQRLSQRLWNGKTLLILDDVWEKLDFEGVGIPFHENNKGCPVLLTTRSREVCSSMQCQSIIELNLLTAEEAWTLFKLNANIKDDCPDTLEAVARKIVSECKGLPIAIVTVGSTLKGKFLEEWKLALTRLEDSKPLVIPKGLTSPHLCLKLSYDNLTDELAKSLFLLCSIFPEDHEIDLEDLFRFGRGLGLTGTIGTMERARREMHVAVNILKDSCLLLHASNYKVKMHDLVRDVALWIASERGEAILASTGMDPRMLVEDETIKDKRAISLWHLENGQLPDDQLNCASLEILLLHSPKVGFEVPNACLERLEMLKILAFFKSDYNYYYWIEDRYRLSLPQSIESLKNLHTLCLRGYKLGDISILESLQALEIIDLRGSSFEELPNGIVALKKLKLLDLYKCRIAKKNAYEVIGRCLQLEELYVSIYRDREDIPHNVSFSRLRRYVIVKNRNTHRYIIHEVDYFLEKHRSSRALCIHGFNASAESFMSLPIKDLFLRAEYLHLQQLRGGYKNVIPSMDPEGMIELTVLILKDCTEIECLFDDDDMLQTEVVFSSLVSLSLCQMDSLQEVFRDPSSRCCLKNLQELKIEKCRQLHSISFPRNSKLCCLKELTIRHCPMLASLFTPSIVQTLVLLESLEIQNCSELKHIIEEVEEGNVDYYVSSQSHQYHTSLTLPKLKSLDIYGCDRLEYVLPMCFAGGLVSLERLSIWSCWLLKYVFGSEKEHRLSALEINLLNLNDLKLYSLPNLVDIWPEYCCQRLPKLKQLKCNECPRLSLSLVPKEGIDSDLQHETTATEKEILWLVSPQFRKVDLSDNGVKGLFQFQIEEPAGSNRELVPLNMDLAWVNLENLSELKFIWKGPTNFLSLQVLEYISVDGCPKLKSIFSPTIVRSLPGLRRLEILNCEELEQIFDLGGAQLKSLYTRSQQVCFPKLEIIRVQNCNKLKCFFYNFKAGHFLNLCTLKIKECSQLEKVFAFELEADDDGQQGTRDDGEQVLLQNLRNITLTSLQNFKEIHHGFKLKEHVEHIINDCPKYSPSLYLHPDI